MAILTREQILAADDLPRRQVACPEWGGDVFVRGLTARERDLYDIETLGNRGDQAKMDCWRVRMVGRCIVDEKGKRMFKDTEIEELANKSAAPVKRLFDAITELSGMTPGAVEDAEKNSSAGQDAASP